MKKIYVNSFKPYGGSKTAFEYQAGRKIMTRCNTKNIVCSLDKKCVSALMRLAFFALDLKTATTNIIIFPRCTVLVI